MPKGCATKWVFHKKSIVYSTVFTHCIVLSILSIEVSTLWIRIKHIYLQVSLTPKHLWTSYPHFIIQLSRAIVSFSKPQSKYLPKAKFSAALQAQHMAMPVSNPIERHLSGVPFRPMTAACGRVLRVCEVLFEFSKWLQQELPWGW